MIVARAGPARAMALRVSTISRACAPTSAQSVAARFAVSLGVAPLSLPGVLVIELPTLAELIGSGSGKRRVWSKLKPLLRELGR